MHGILPLFLECTCAHKKDKKMLPVESTIQLAKMMWQVLIEFIDNLKQVKKRQVQVSQVVSLLDFWFVVLQNTVRCNFCTHPSNSSLSFIESCDCSLIFYHIFSATWVLIPPASQPPSATDGDDKTLKYKYREGDAARRNSTITFHFSVAESSLSDVKDAEKRAITPDTEKEHCLLPSPPAIQIKVEWR